MSEGEGKRGGERLSVSQSPSLAPAVCLSDCLRPQRNEASERLTRLSSLAAACERGKREQEQEWAHTHTGCARGRRGCTESE